MSQQSRFDAKWQRQDLADGLLKILTEEVVGDDANDPLEAQMVRCAKAALAAAEVMYPEPPDDSVSLEP